MNDNQSYRSIWTFLNQTEHSLRTVDAGGIKTRVLLAGNPENPAVLLLHGTAGSLENFCANYEALSSKYYVIGFDMLGCGYTDKPAFDYHISDYSAHAKSLLDALEIEKAFLVGVSLGSWVAAHLAMNESERILGLISLAPAGIVVNVDKERAFATGVRKRRSKAAAEPTWETVKHAMSGLMLKPEDLLDDLIATRLAIYSQEVMKEAMPRLLAFTSSGSALTETQWENLETPMLIVASIDAPNMFLDNAYAIARIAPSARLVEMRGCDHWPQFEQPDEFNRLALSFFDEFVAVNL